MQPTLTHGPQGGVPQGVNQMLEIFKMQYLMKFLDSSGTGGSRGSMFTIFVLMAYDHVVRYIPVLFAMVQAWIQKSNPSSLQIKEPLLLPLPQQQAPPQKSVKAYIQFERSADGKLSDPRIDAVMHHVCSLPEVRSLRYNGVEMVPNFKDTLMIENDIWFEIQTQTAISVDTGRREPITYRLSTYDHDITWLHKFVDQTIERFDADKRNKLGSETYYFDQVPQSSDPYRNPLTGQFCMFNKSRFTSNRSLNNVYLRQIGELKERVDFFLHRRDWYDEKGIPHTLGIVMYGHPGCGKTSTIKAIANETKRHIFNIMLSEIKTKDALKALFYNDEVHVMQDGKLETLNIPLKNRLFVIEDIDAMNSVVTKRSVEAAKEDEERKLRLEAEMEIIKKVQGEVAAQSMMKGKQSSESNQLDLATLLNVLDGVRETPGRIIILSTNYPERLDEALLRPGRFDMMLEFEKHSRSVLQQHLEKHYDCILTEQQLRKLSDPSLEKKWTPAEVCQICFRRISSPDAAIDDLVYEHPEKLFKYSQIKSQGQHQHHKQPPEPEPVQGTRFEELFQEAQVVEPEPEPEPELIQTTTTTTIHTTTEDSFEETITPSSISNVLVVMPRPINQISTEQEKTSPPDDDDIDSMYGGTISGGISMDVDRPTAEQLAAEEAVRKQLFPEFASREDYDINPYSSSRSINYEERVASILKNSPMFQTQPDDVCAGNEALIQMYTPVVGIRTGVLGTKDETSLLQPNQAVANPFQPNDVSLDDLYEEITPNLGATP